jgi:hypothetical protein
MVKKKKRLKLMKIKKRMKKRGRARLLRTRMTMKILASRLSILLIKILGKMKTSQMLTTRQFW